MYQTTLTPAIPEVWNTIVKQIGGKRIKSVTISCNTNNNFCSPDITISNSLRIPDAIMLKNSKYMIFCTYNLRNRTAIFKTPISDITDICFVEYKSNV